MAAIVINFINKHKDLSDIVINFGVVTSSSGNKHVLIDNNYAYIHTTGGIAVYDVSTELLCSYIINDYISCFDINTYGLYLCIEGYGIFYIDKSIIIPDVNLPQNLSSYITNPVMAFNYTNFNCISSADSYLCFTTNSGVEHYCLGDEPYRYSFTTISGAEKCLQTESGSFYYTLNSGTWLCRIDNYKCDWSEPDYIYPNQYIDFDSKINSFCKDNYFYIATTSGVYVVNELTDEYDYISKDLYYTDFDSNNFIDVEYKNNSLNIATTSGLYILDNDYKIKNKYMFDNEIIDTDV